MREKRGATAKNEKRPKAADRRDYECRGATFVYHVTTEGAELSAV